MKVSKAHRAAGPRAAGGQAEKHVGALHRFGERPRRIVSGRTDLVRGSSGPGLPR